MEYGWAHGLGEVVTALAGAGLQLELLHERPTLDWPVPFLVEVGDGSYGLPEGTPGELPLMFSLRARARGLTGPRPVGVPRHQKGCPSGAAR